jgi:L-lactate dehydrogenase complex protein LldG
MSELARTEILERIRATRSGESPDVTVPRDYHRPGTMAGADLTEILADRLADYGALVHRCPAAGVPAAIAKALRERAAHRVAVPAGLPAEWVSALPQPLLDRSRLGASELSAADAVITSVTIAVAQTGTLVLDHGPGQGRRELTLIPDLHLAVVASERIVAAVPDAVAALDPISPLTWISGPSATSDIELERVQGVHGPRTLIVIIVDHLRGTCGRQEPAASDGR